MNSEYINQLATEGRILLHYALNYPSITNTYNETDNDTDNDIMYCGTITESQSLDNRFKTAEQKGEICDLTQDNYDNRRVHFDDKCTIIGDSDNHTTLDEKS